MTVYAPTSKARSCGLRAVRKTPPAGAPRPKLLDRVREAVRARHYSRRTEKAYIHWTRRYIFFPHDKRHPAQTGAAEVTTFLTSSSGTRSLPPLRTRP